jgi:prefoldin subunit 5
MKSLSFKRKGASIRVMPDIQSKRSINWDRWVYLAFLSALILFVGWYVFKRIFFVEADGQVLYENVNVRNLDDSRILKYYVMEDDTVAVGDTLFMYVADDEEFNGNGSSTSMTLSAEGGSGYDWIDKEIYALRRKIVVNNTDIRSKQERIGQIEKELPKLKNEVILDAMPLARLDTRQEELNKLKAEKSQLEAENGELNKLIVQLQGMKENEPQPKTAGQVNVGNGIGGIAGIDPSRIRWHLSPLEGSINRIYTRAFETALRADIIMSIHRNSPIYVRAFFNQNDLEYFHEGDEVRLKFPDGTTSRGILRRFYFATVPLPEEFQKRYEPVQRSIAADIYPADTTDQNGWRTFYKMSVEVSKFKY